jgi:AcrR family transcriptional regulator
MAALARNPPTPPGWPEDRGGSLELDTIAAAAIELIDEGGPTQLTMRRLADRLDTAPMTIYWYVANRAELLAVVRDAAMAPVLDRLDDGAGWQAALRSLALALHEEVITAHPNLAPIVATGEHAPGPNVLRMIDRVLATLMADGFTTVDATWAFQVVANAALTFRSEVSVTGLESLVEQGVEGFPTLTAVMREYADMPETIDQFPRTLDAAIHGIAATLDRSPA